MNATTIDLVEVTVHRVELRDAPTLSGHSVAVVHGDWCGVPASWTLVDPDHAVIGAAQLVLDTFGHASAEIDPGRVTVRCPDRRWRSLNSLLDWIAAVHPTNFDPNQEPF